MIKPRKYRGYEDLPLMVQLVKRVNFKRGVPVGFQVGDMAWRMLRDPAFVAQDNIILWEQQDGRAVGLAMIYRFSQGYAIDLQVDPEIRGLEREMWLWLIPKMEDRLREDVRQALFTSTYGLESSRVDDLKALGFNRDAGVYVQMVRGIEDMLPPMPLPAGISICRVEEKDMDARVRLHRDTLNRAFTEEAYHRLRDFPLYNPELDLVAVTPDGSLAGLILCWFVQEDVTAEIEPLAVLPNFRRKGIGRALVYEGLRRLRQCSAKWVTASTGNNNIAAKHLYSACGFSCMELEYDFSRPLR